MSDCEEYARLSYLLVLFASILLDLMQLLSFYCFLKFQHIPIKENWKNRQDLALLTVYKKLKMIVFNN